MFFFVNSTTSNITTGNTDGSQEENENDNDETDDNETDGKNVTGEDDSIPLGMDNKSQGTEDSQSDSGIQSSRAITSTSNQKLQVQL